MVSGALGDTDLVGRCGLYCGACGIYRAERDDGAYLDRVASFLKCPPEKVRCEGCQALSPECWGNECEILKCLNGKGFQYCYECSEYDKRTCQRFEKFSGDYLKEDKVDLRANLTRIKAGQADAWLNESAERFRCPHCGKPLPTSSFRKKCYHCDQTLSS